MNLAARLHLLRGPALAAHAAYSNGVCSGLVYQLSRHALHTESAWTTSLADQHHVLSVRCHSSAVEAANLGGDGAAEAVAAAAIGQVMAAQANFVRIKVDRVEGAEEGTPPPRAHLLCVVRGLLKKIKQKVLVGDRVRIVGIDWADGRGMVEDVLPRSSLLAEPAVANVTHVLLVFAADMPPFQPSPATRFLLSAEAAGLPVTLVLNKTDLVGEESVAWLIDQVKGWGYQVLPVSVLTGQGLDELTHALQGQVSVVAGPSGAGKSSIINALRLRSLGLEGTLEAMRAEPSGWDAEEEQAGSGNGDSANSCAEAEEPEQQQDRQQRAGADAASLNSNGANGAAGDGTPSGGAEEVGGLDLAGLDLQAVGQVSQRIGRGKHTTRNVSLLEMGSGGLVVDTPGFNQPDLSMPASELGSHFPEIRAILEEQRCTFRSCQHLQEPGCVVRGEWERYPLYCDIHAELRALEQGEAARTGGKKRREGMVRFKSRAGGQQGIEARLESKSYRRESRRSVKQDLTGLARDVEEEEEEEEEVEAR